MLQEVEAGDPRSPEPDLAKELAVAPLVMLSLPFLARHGSNVFNLVFGGACLLVLALCCLLFWQRSTP